MENSLQMRRLLSSTPVLGIALQPLYFTLPSHCTVFQAEVKAVLEAAKILEILPQYTDIKFFIDSQAAIKALASTDLTSKLVVKTVEALNRVSSNRNIKLRWTRAHIGTYGNERADEGAKKGSTLELVQNIDIPKAELKNCIENYFYLEWEKSWTKYGKARMTKLFFI